MLVRRNLQSLALLLPDYVAGQFTGHALLLDQWLHLERLNALNLAQAPFRVFHQPVG